MAEISNSFDKAPVILNTSEGHMGLIAVEHPNGSYRYLPAISAYSAGFATSVGFEITALRLLDCPSLDQGFKRIDAEIKQRGLTSSALAGIQLRSPGAFSFDGFAKFNNEYRQLLVERSLILEDANPVSRTNVIPIHEGPSEPSIAMAFIVHPSKGLGGTDFIVAGAGEVAGDLGPENIIARGDLSPHGLNLKVECVLDIMVERLVGLGASGKSPTTINVYTVHEISNLAASIEAKIASIAKYGYASWLTRPPVKEIEFEMDCSRYSNWVSI
ncbi:MAG: hypothetical protein F2845_02620 [Actinobacteria bacterium]|nr:hypothetical protein [Actinomycetota bacterium]MSW33866.1 hypothetical protein [Actinomycetota bacterium]MSX30851.1 hypothetical protein [Actinomycetota bacterium]MSY49828.1 hypothetical protein [Actinomycetota bacterium]